MGNICNKHLQSYLNERIQKQNEKIFNLECNCKHIITEQNRLKEYIRKLESDILRIKDDENKKRNFILSKWF